MAASSRTWCAGHADPGEARRNMELGAEPYEVGLHGARASMGVAGLCNVHCRAMPSCRCRGIGTWGVLSFFVPRFGRTTPFGQDVARLLQRGSCGPAYARPWSASPVWRAAYRRAPAEYANAPPLATMLFGACLCLGLSVASIKCRRSITPKQVDDGGRECVAQDGSRIRLHRARIGADIATLIRPRPPNLAPPHQAPVAPALVQFRVAPSFVSPNPVTFLGGPPLPTWGPCSPPLFDPPIETSRRWPTRRTQIPPFPVAENSCGWGAGAQLPRAVSAHRALTDLQRIQR